jgi:hypothetical protein
MIMLEKLINRILHCIDRRNGLLVILKHFAQSKFNALCVCVLVICIISILPTPTHTKINRKFRVATEKGALFLVEHIFIFRIYEIYIGITLKKLIFLA